MVGVDRGVDRAQVLDDLLVLAARDVLEAGADEVHDAGLHRGGGKHRFDRLREAGETVDAADQDVSEAAVAQLVEDLHPELRALGVLKPQPEHLAGAVHPDRHRQVARLALQRCRRRGS